MGHRPGGHGGRDDGRGAAGRARLRDRRVDHLAAGRLPRARGPARRRPRRDPDDRHGGRRHHRHPRLVGCVARDPSTGRRPRAGARAGLPADPGRCRPHPGPRAAQSHRRPPAAASDRAAARGAAPRSLRARVPAGARHRLRCPRGRLGGRARPPRRAPGGRLAPGRPGPDGSGSGPARRLRSRLDPRRRSDGRGRRSPGAARLRGGVRRPPRAHPARRLPRLHRAAARLPGQRLRQAPARGQRRPGRQPAPVRGAGHLRRHLVEGGQRHRPGARRRPLPPHLRHRRQPGRRPPGVRQRHGAEGLEPALGAHRRERSVARLRPARARRSARGGALQPGDRTRR